MPFVEDFTPFVVQKNKLGQPLTSSIKKIITSSVFYPEVVLVNVSNDTFPSNETYSLATFQILYADTRQIVGYYTPISFSIGKSFFVMVGFNIEINLLVEAIDFYDSVIDFEQVIYRELQIGITKKMGIMKTNQEWLHDVLIKHWDAF